MSSTRQHTHLTPIKIYNDAWDADQAQQALSHSISSPMENVPNLMPSAGVLAPRSDTNARLIPPPQAGKSPYKRGPRGRSPPLKQGLSGNGIMLYPTSKSQHATDSLVKQPSPPSHAAVSPRPGQGRAFPYTTPSGLDQENLFQSYGSDNFAEFPASASHIMSATSNKRALPDTAAELERPSKTQRLGSGPARIPEPHEMPEVVDNGDKPRYSYAQLIAMAILRSPERKLTLADIYKWISDHFDHFRRIPQSGWQNSIRHNLSLHKAFKKQDRPRNDPGKGHYWVIEDDKVSEFLDERQSRRPASSHGSQLQSAAQQQRVQQPQQASQPRINVGMQPPAARHQPTFLPPPPCPQPKPERTAAEPSSDATLPLSDPALLEEDQTTYVDIARPSSRANPSSPQLKSSPPVAPPRLRTTASVGTDVLSLQGSKKRKRASMNDSGYYSSLESSATRQSQSRAGLDSLALSRLNHGRAEEEIARLRSSSQDVSPSKGPAYGIPRPSTPGLMSSSPTHLLDSNPLTPGVRAPPKLNVPKPRPALAMESPETQLRNHRNKVHGLIRTPEKGLYDVPAPFEGISPALNVIDDHSFDLANLTPGIKFNIFADDQSPLRQRALASDPRRGVRPGLLRSNTTPTAKILGEIAKSAVGRPSPSLKPPVTFQPPLGSPFRFASPEKCEAATSVQTSGLPLASSPFKDFFADLQSPTKSGNAAQPYSPFKFSSPGKLFTSNLGSPVKGVDFGNLDPTTDLFSFDMFAGDVSKTNSPVREAKQSGLDLAGGFQKIGEAARQGKENMGPPAKKAKTASASRRPALGSRSNTVI